MCHIFYHPNIAYHAIFTKTSFFNYSNLHRSLGDLGVKGEATPIYWASEGPKSSNFEKIKVSRKNWVMEF